MRRALGMMLVIAIIAAACGGEDDPATTTTTAPATTATAAPVESADPPQEWPATNAEQLIALEEANDGQWTIDGALEAVGLVREVLRQGTDAYPPIDTTRLTVFLAENFDRVPQQEWDLTLASGINARPAAFFQTEEQRRVYQDIAERANADFERLSGHTLGIPIYVALSDLPFPGHLYAGTIVNSDNINAFTAWFDDPDLFTDTEAAFEELTSGGGEACVIVLGGIMRSWDANRQVSGLLHEVVHCHQHVIHPGGRTGFLASPEKWMDEGYAAYAGDAFFGGTLSSIPWWNDYFDGGIGSSDDGFNVFRGSYSSMPFYAMVAAGGVDPYPQVIPWFGELRGNGVSDVARLSGMLGGVAPEVIAGWAASASRDDALGSPWNSASGPGIGGSWEERDPRMLTAGPELLGRSVDPGEQRYWAMRFTTDVDEPSLITIEAEGYATLQWEHESWDEQYVTVGDGFARTWCVGEDCVCDDGSSPAPGALPAPLEGGDTAVLHAALFGAGSSSIWAASIETLEDACEEEDDPPVDAGPLDACLFGIWNPDPEQFRDLMLTQYESLGMTGVELAGTIALAFNEDGSYSQDYVGVVASGTVLGETGTATLSGGAFGTWSASGGVITLNIEGGAFDATLNGEGFGSGPPLQPTSVQGGYTCGPTTLEIDPPTIAGGLLPFPTDWTTGR